MLLAEDGKALNRLLTRENIDMIVLDLMLPGEDGLSICRRLRAANDTTPIIMLTAKVEDVDRIVGLEVGADDYLPKPFNPRELLARIHAVLRRRPAQEAPGAPSKEAQVAHFGPFEFDLSLRRLTKDGEPIALTPALRFSTGVLGGVFLGWIVSLTFTLRIAMAMGSTGRPLWAASTLGLGAWYGVDSTLSVATGFGLNVLPNTLALALFLIGLFCSGVLRSKP